MLTNQVAFDVNFPGGYALGRVRRFEVREGVGVHQIAIIDVILPKTMTSVPPEGTPVSVRWGRLPEVRTFHGYVNHHEVSNEGRLPNLRVYLIGTSLPLNSTNPTTWGPVSGSYVAKTVAERHGLRAVVSKCNEILPHWTQGIESDFAMMGRLAERVGVEFWVDAATLYFLDPSQLTARVNFLGGVTHLGRSGAGVGENNLLTFETISGSLAPGIGVPEVTDVYGMDNTGQVIRATSAKSLKDLGLAVPSNKSIVGDTISSPFEAQKVVDASTNRGRWVSASVTIRPDPKLRTGSVVNLDGPLVRDTHRGLWSVKSVVNVIRPAAQRAWTSELLVTRNQESSQKFTSRTFAGITPAPAARLWDGAQWQSASLETIYV